MTQPLPREPHDGIKADAGAESEGAERNQSSYVARGGQSSGMVASGPEPGDEQPSQAVAGGTASGDALSGVTAEPGELDDAVSGDMGPEHSGQR